jgi:hypothetical protein
VTPREIVAEAWAIAKREKRLWQWGFVASFFAILLSVKFLSFQTYISYEYFFGANKAGMFDMELWLIHNTPQWFWVSTFITFVVLLVIEFFMPHFTEGAIIGLTVKAHRGEPLEGGLVLGLYNFFSMFAIHEFFFLASWNLVISGISLTLRYLPQPMHPVIIPAIIFLFIFSNFFSFLTSFAPEGCVIKKMGPVESAMRSYKLIVSHLGHVVFLMILLLVISVRIVINTFVVFLIPAAVVGIALLLTYVFSPFVSYLIGGALGVALIGLASYSLAYLHVFRRAVWTLTFLELDGRKDLDHL